MDFKNFLEYKLFFKVLKILSFLQGGRRNYESVMEIPHIKVSAYVISKIFSTKEVRN